MNRLEFHNKLIENTKEFLADIKTPADLEKLTIFLLLHYLIKSYKLMKGINLLSREQLNSDSKILLRSLFEAFLLSAYITGDLKDITRAEDCAIRALFAEKKEVEHLKNLGFFDIQNTNDDDIKRKIIDKNPEIEQHIKTTVGNYEDSLNKLRKRHEYTSLSDKEIQERFENKIANRIIEIVNKKYEKTNGVNKNVIHKYYATVFRDTSNSIHCNDLWDHVSKNKNDGRWEFSLIDSDRYEDIILITSANLFIEIMHNVNQALNLGKDSLINKLFEEYKECRGF